MAWGGLLGPCVGLWGGGVEVYTRPLVVYTSPPTPFWGNFGLPRAPFWAPLCIVAVSGCVLLCLPLLCPVVSGGASWNRFAPDLHLIKRRGVLRVGGCRLVGRRNHALTTRPVRRTMRAGVRPAARQSLL